MSKKPEQIGGTERAFNTFAQSAKAKKTQPVASEAEKAQRKAEGRTRGRTGCKADRINLAFTVDNYNFVKRFARCKGMSMTDFVNYIIEEYRKSNQKEFEKIEEFINKSL